VAIGGVGSVECLPLPIGLGIPIVRGVSYRGSYSLNEIGAIRPGSLFSTSPTRRLTSQHIIFRKGRASSTSSWATSVGASPSQTGQVPGFSARSFARAKVRT